MPDSYVGHRILQAMKAAPTYSDAIFAAMRRVGPAGAILDFGAGEGTFAEKFYALGVAVDCVEPDVDLRARLIGVAGAVYPLIRDVPDNRFDFVYTVNVLEHVDDLHHACSELLRVLKPGGRLFVFVPAFQVLWTSLDDEVGHRRRFTRHALAHALTGSGFAVCEIEYFDTLGFPAALAVRVLEKLGLFTYSRTTISFYDRLIFPISRKADTAFSGMFGKNLIAVAEKEAGPGKGVVAGVVAGIEQAPMRME